jgi:hypothetical protein
MFGGWERGGLLASAALLGLVAACSGSSGPEVGDVAAPKLPAPLPDGSAGGSVAIAGSSPLSGTYVLTEGAGCGGTGTVTFSASASAGTITASVVGVVLDAGATATTPKATVTLKFGTVDDGTYPSGGAGTCSVTYESGAWPTHVNAQFACTGLVGIGSGKPFALSGYVDCAS